MAFTTDPVAEQQTARIDLQRLKEQNKVIKPGEFATLYDIDDGIICLELHTKSSAINSELVLFMQAAQEELNKNWDGMVIAGRGRNFCVGADLTVVAQLIDEQNWQLLDQLLARTHTVYRANKYSAKPVVAAIHGMVLGGGCEMVLQSPMVQAAADSFIGLVEVGVGLIPAGGGVKEAMLKVYDKVLSCNADPAKALWPYLKSIVLKKISNSARNAMQIDYLKNSAGISMELADLLTDAKLRALKMKESSYKAPQQISIPAFGSSELEPLTDQCEQLREAGYMTEYDLFIAGRIIELMAGAGQPTGTLLSEEFIEAAERELFISLCGNQKTQERISYMLKNGKPLRN